jgi:hypothetical protein
MERFTSLCRRTSILFEQGKKCKIIVEIRNKGQTQISLTLFGLELIVGESLKTA